MNYIITYQTTYMKKTLTDSAEYSIRFYDLSSARKMLDLIRSMGYTASIEYFEEPKIETTKPTLQELSHDPQF